MGYIMLIKYSKPVVVVWSLRSVYKIYSNNWVSSLPIISGPGYFIKNASACPPTASLQSSSALWMGYACSSQGTGSPKAGWVFEKMHLTNRGLRPMGMI